MSAYQLLRDQWIEELRSNVRLLQHRQSGALLLHLANEDPENVFCLSLSTLPTDSSGVAHILEHMTLCGSRNYPVKDPFFAMTRRSLNTFMNAFTGSDFTCYPAASQNRTDFYNLLDVYLDAVFFPSLDRRSFAQEGHRLEWSDRAAKKGLLRAGIVYNEMKGAYINPTGHLWKRLYEQLLDETIYRFDSGGDPLHIPELTYEQLLAFHKTYYHPSRCLYFFYGSIDTQEHAHYLHERLLKGVERPDSLPARNKQSRWQAPRAHQSVYPASDAEEKPMAALSWLTYSIEQTRDNLLLELLDYLLMGHDGALLKSFLLESQLVEQASSSLDQEMLEIPYTLVLKGCSGSLEPLSRAIIERLETIYQEGFGREAIESALHQLKIDRLEIGGSSYPFGLDLFFRAGLAMQQGADPIDTLKLHSHFETLRHLPENPGELLSTLRQLLDNPHRLDLWLLPDLEWASRAQQSESQQLEQIEAQLLLQEKQQIATLAEQLQQEQEKEESVELLPKIEIAQIDRLSPKIDLSHTSPSVFAHSCFTNGFTYVETHLQLEPRFAQQLNPQQWHELKLLAYLWPRLGASGRSYGQQLQQLDLHSAGCGCTLQVTTPIQPVEPGQGLASLLFSIHGLSEQLPHFAPLYEQTIFEGRLDELERITQLLQSWLANLQNQLPSKALQYALSASCASFHPLSGLLDWLDGLPFIEFLRQEVQLIKTAGPAQLSQRLAQLKAQLLAHSHAVSNISCNEADLPIAELKLAGIHGRLVPSSTPLLLQLPHLPLPTLERYELNSQVNFIALSLPGPDLLQSDGMGLRLACELIRHQVLHPEIREKGGAYGYGCSWSPDKRAISFHSYRDPHLDRTLEVFAQGADEIAKGHFHPEALEEAKRCWIQRLDKPIRPGERASVAFSWQLCGMNLELRNRLRQQLLDASACAVQEAARRYLQQRWQERRICVFGPKGHPQPSTSS